MIINFLTFESRENLKQRFDKVNIALSSNVHFTQSILNDWLVYTDVNKMTSFKGKGDFAKWHSDKWHTAECHGNIFNGCRFTLNERF